MVLIALEVLNEENLVISPSACRDCCDGAVDRMNDVNDADRDGDDIDADTCKVSCSFSLLTRLLAC